MLIAALALAGAAVAAPAATPGGEAAARLALLAGRTPAETIALLAAATFVSEDLACIGAGLLVRRGEMPAGVALAGCILGIFVGDLGLLLAGRVLGRRLLAWPWVARRVPPQRLAEARAWLDDRVGRAVLVSRFVPGMRLPLYLAAGALTERAGRFAAWFAAASLLWVPLLVLASATLGDALVAPLERWVGGGWLGVLLGALVLLVLLRVGAACVRRNGRRRLHARLARLWRWEFWPAWAFYLPLAPWIAWLWARHRGAAFTAANPGIPHSGFVGESKRRILEHVPAPWAVPTLAFEPADPASRAATVRAALCGAGWAGPFVVKPDVGERGCGVRFAPDAEAAAACAADAPGVVLVQAWHPGPGEAGIFYVRHPDDAAGRIFSITAKRFPAVIGDGASSLRELVLADRRLRMQAAVFLARHDGARVPAAGERVVLARAGNHCQGTMFLDGAHLRTEALETRIDAIARAIPGFHFGRFDVRYRDEAAFRRGEDLAIVEVNGVTSESTNVYDPDYGLLRAWRTIAEQWRLAFAIGAANRDRGAPVASAGELFAALRDHRRRAGRDAPAD